MEVNVVTNQDLSTHNGHKQDHDNADTTHAGYEEQKEHVSAQRHYILHFNKNVIQNHISNARDQSVDGEEADEHQAGDTTDMKENIMTYNEPGVVIDSINHKEGAWGDRIDNDMAENETNYIHNIIDHEASDKNLTWSTTSRLLPQQYILSPKA